MFEKLANIFRVPDLRKRVLFTLAMLAVYRFGSHIPTPGIDAAALSRIFENLRGGMKHRSYQAEFAEKTLSLNIYVMPEGKYEQFLVEQ